MQTKNHVLVSALAVLLAASFSANAAEKPGKPLNIKPSPATSAPPADNWRERAMKARAEFAPDGDGAVPLGRSRALDERGDRGDGQEAGAGALGQDQGEGGGKEE